MKEDNFLGLLSKLLGKTKNRKKFCKINKKYLRSMHGTKKIIGFVA
jgi:hypothetical protein